MSLCIGQDGKRKLCVGKLPGRVRHSLYFWDPHEMRVLASFNSEDSADEARAFLEGLIGARIVDGEASEK